MTLFERGGLQQETGLLKARWAQDGSELVNGYKLNPMSEILRSTTTGKIFYIQSIILTNLSSSTMGINIWDYVSGPNMIQRHEIHLPAGYAQNITQFFDPPLKFISYFRLGWIGTVRSCTITYLGWEEDAPN